MKKPHEQHDHIPREQAVQPLIGFGPTDLAG